MTTWRPTDMLDLWGILKLDREQLVPNSTLNYLMDYACNFDTNYGTTVVSQVQTLIDEIKDLKTNNPVPTDGLDRIKRFEEHNEYELEFYQGSRYQAVRAEIDGKTAQIQNLLDTYRHLLQYQSPYFSRVVV